MEDYTLCPLYNIGEGCKTGKAVGETRCAKYKAGCATFVFYNENGITWSEYCLKNSVHREEPTSSSLDLGKIVEQHFQGQVPGNGNGHSNGNGKAKRVSPIAASFT